MGARILVIEDNPANLQLMTYLLKAFGHEPSAAATGEEGLERLSREPWDIVLCDIQLPKMDGYEVARRLRADPAFRTSLVAVTAYAMVGDREKVLAAGFDGYIPKPIVPQTFVRQVEEFLPAGVAPGPEPRRDTRSVESPLPARATRRWILAVDNTGQNLDFVRRALSPFGYEVSVASTVKEALEAARRKVPDLILSDIHMPKESGYDLIRLARLDPRLREIPIVLTSSTFSGEVDEKTAREMGADKFLLRPIGPAELLAEIEECFARRGERR